MGVTEPPHQREVIPRSSRREGMEHMLVATVQLLTERRPEDVTVRDVAEASGHHHRFVQAWFGGKVGLFRATFERMSDEVASRVTTELQGGALTDAARALARLLNWLVAADPEAFSGQRRTPVIDRTAEAYELGLGVEPDVARMLATRAVATSIAIMLFSDALGLDDDDVPALVQLDREMVQLLVAARGDQQR